MSAWEETLWAELDGLDPADQVVQSGNWILRMTQEILPQLAARRREKIVEILGTDEWDATRLAEAIGTRRTTILRLAEEGRAATREVSKS